MRTRTMILGHTAMLIVMAGVVVCSTAHAAATVFLQDGKGFWWDFDGAGAVIDGSAVDHETTDAFDGAMRLSVDGNAFPSASQITETGGRVVATGPATMSGLSVMRRAYVPNAPGEGWACFMEYFQNPTAADISVTAQVLGNVGSDNDTTVTASSSGDAVFTPADRWVTSDDNNDAAGDPSLSFNYWGVGAAVTPSAVLLPASQDDYYVNYLITVPAGLRVVLMHFTSQNANNAAARATAEHIDALPAAALVGLYEDFSPVVNWNIPSDMEVTPTGPFTPSGQQGGPFAPATCQYTVRKAGTGSFNWSVTAPSWISLTYDLEPDGMGTVDATLNTGANSLTPGVHNAAMVFHNLTAGMDTIRNIQLTVRERLGVTPETGYAAEGFQGGPFTQENIVYTLANTGTNGDLDWSVTGPAWLDITPNTGVLIVAATTPVTVAPNAAAQALAPGTHTGTLTFLNETFGTPVTRDVQLVVNERMAITPADRFVSRGRLGGPFSPATNIYTLTNRGALPIDWSVAAPATWLTFAPPSGTALAPGASVDITATINGAADTMGLGDHPGTITFTNTTYGSLLTREALLRIHGVVFVDASLPAAGNGSSWAQAFKSIQAGIDSAAPSKSMVWVADGTYTERIAMAEGVDVYGGFVGNETQLSERAPAAHVAIIDGNEGGSVVTFAAIADAGLDGFTIIHGHAAGLAPLNCGGGVRCDGASTTNFIGHCMIRNNKADYRGAGIYCGNGAAPFIDNCVIVGNETNADFGGGIGCVESSPAIRNCNVCANHGRFGAGIGCIKASPTVENCVISGNLSSSYNSTTSVWDGSGGGGVFAHDHSSPTITNCVISGNYTRNWSAGALYCQGTSKPVLTNCTISSNVSRHEDPAAVPHGGVVVNTGSAPTLVNCILHAIKGTAIVEEGPWPSIPANQAEVFVTNCLFEGNTPTDFHNDIMGVGTDYSGGDVINAHVNGAANNLAGNPLPQFATGITGTWSVAPAYNAVDNVTVLTTTASLPGNLSGALLNADTAQERHAFILDATAHTIRVVGDITSATGLFGYADSGDMFAVLDYHLLGNSPCIDAGKSAGASILPRDLDGHTRVQHGAVDLGAYENAAPGSVTVGIALAGAPVINTPTVDFLVTFSRAIASGLTEADFAIRATGGQTGATIDSVSGHDYRWVVTVQIGAGNGTLSVDLLDTSPAVTDVIGNALAGNYTTAPAYTIDLLNFTTQPQGGYKRPGESFDFDVLAEGGVDAVHYGWKKGGEPILGSPDAPHFELSSNLVLDDTGIYTCDATDGTITVTSNTAALQVASPLHIVTQPRGGHKLIDTPCTFFVETSGGFQPLTYVWKHNESPILTATGASFTIDRLKLEDTGSYTVTISGAYVDVAQSEPAMLYVSTTLPVPVLDLAGVAGLVCLLAWRGRRAIQRRNTQ